MSFAGVISIFRYTGRGGDQNYPGLGGRPPLVIAASRFVIYFHSDLRNNDWGYKFTVRAELPHESLSMKADGAFDLNPAPIYIGQPPSYASSSRAATVNICSFNVYEHALGAREIGDLVVAAPSEQTIVADNRFCLNVLSGDV